MDIDSLVQDQQKSGGGGSSDLKESQLKFEAGKPVIIKIDPKQIEVVHEIWLRPSNNLPADKPADTKYVFTLKKKTASDKSEHALLAELIGNPQDWNVGKNKKPWYGYHKGGIYEFTYTEHKAADGFKKRIYLHMVKPEHKQFFQEFAFYGKQFALDKYPEAGINLRYSVNTLVAENAYCASKKSLMWTNFSNGIFQKLMDCHVEGYHLDKTWFKITRTGEGQTTDYSLLPLPLNASTELDKAYGSLDDYAKPEIAKNSALATNYYAWKYLQKYIEYADGMLGTQYSTIFKKDYEETEKKKQEYAAAQAQGQAPGAVPSEVQSELSQVSNSAAHFDSGAMSDDDIPF